jgi:hypothetical protein
MGATKSYQEVVMYNLQLNADSSATYKEAIDVPLLGRRM